jgi:tetratricopeptide (TPR) repeat protein
MAKSLLLVTIIFLFPFIILSQDVKNNQSDTDKIKSLNKRSYDLIESNPDSATLLAKEAILLSEKINYLQGLGDGYNRLGVIEKSKGNLPEAIRFYHNSLFYRKQLGNPDYLGRVYNNLGNAYQKMGNFDSAVYYLLTALRIAESMNDKDGIIKYTNNLGLAYNENKDAVNAETYFQKSLDISVEQGDTNAITRACANLGAASYYLGNYKQAVSYSKKAISLATPLDDQKNLSTANNTLGSVYTDIDKPDSALFFLKKAAAIDSTLDNQANWAADISNIGIVYIAKKDFARAIRYLNQSVDMAKETGDKKLNATNYEHLATAYNAIGDPKNAYEAMLQFRAYNDSIYNENKAKAISDMRTKYESDKKDQENKILTKDVSIQHLQRNIFMGGTLTLLILAIGLFIFFRQKQQIAARNDHIQKQQIGELLNTQEIKSLNAMMEGQEKERKRIAEDLHDRIGSSLAAIKLPHEQCSTHVQHFRGQQ